MSSSQDLMEQGYAATTASYTGTDMGDVSAAPLSDLRNSWLADYESAKNAPVPPRPSLSDGLGQRLRAIREALSEAQDRRASRRADRAARNAARTAADRQRGEVQKPVLSPVVPAGPIAPAVQEPVVLDLRDSWIADVEANPEKHAPKVVPWYRTLYRELEPLVEEVAFWIDCIKALAHRQTSPKQHRHVARGERARRADMAAQALAAMFAIAFAAGLVVYVAVVVHIFDPHRLAKALAQ